ncbi:hypothetical protein FIE12Z_8476, partial [Fusarium flagelliforme]
DPTTCPVFGPCLDDTTRFPLNPNIPPSLAPTTLQLTRYHFPWINIIPFPRVRDNLIRREGRFDCWELWEDLVGGLMSPTAAAWQRGTPVSLSTLVPKLQLSPSILSGSYTDTDEVTAGRNGLIIWGEPHDMQSWEATPGFLTKWSWAVEGCQELIEIISEVYLEASNVNFEGISVRILCQREERYEFSSDLPTWVLDLRRDHLTLFEAKSTHYKASRGLGEHGEAELRGSKIAVSGYQIDTVHRASVYPTI